MWGPGQPNPGQRPQWAPPVYPQSAQWRPAPPGYFVPANPVITNVTRVKHTLTARNWVFVVTFTAVLAAVVGGLVGYTAASHAQQTIVEKFSPNSAAFAKPTDIQTVLAKVEPAVVSIDTQGTARGHGAVEGAGTGMILTSDGEVLTNNHVVAGASSVTVTLFGQTNPLPARVIGTDPAQDLALIQIEDKQGLPTVQLGDSGRALVGDSVLAIGNALALSGGLTVTEGIVSSKNRSLTAVSDLTGRSENLTGLIQTDAAINSGNSGGPLVNSSGQVIGMNTAVAESTQGNAPAQNIGFAIAIDTIKPLLAFLRSGGSAGSGG
jgi:S1-C subfamily serine protease